MRKRVLLVLLLALLTGCRSVETLDLDRLSPTHYVEAIRAMLADSAPYEGRTLRLTGYMRNPAGWGS